MRVWHPQKVEASRSKIRRGRWRLRHEVTGATTALLTRKDLEQVTGLSQASIGRLVNEEAFSIKHWTLHDAELLHSSDSPPPETAVANTPRTWRIIDPTGVEHTTQNLREFADSRDLDYAKLYAAVREPARELEYLGYRPHPDQEGPKFRPRNKAPCCLVNYAEGRRTRYSTNRSEVAADAGISTQSVWRMASGQAREVRGWHYFESESEAAQSLEHHGAIPSDALTAAATETAKQHVSHWLEESGIDVEGEDDL